MIELKKEVFVKQLGRFATPLKLNDGIVSVQFSRLNKKGYIVKFTSKFKESEFLKLL